MRLLIWYGIHIAFAMATEPKSLSSSDLQLKSEDTIKVTATDPPATVDHMTQVPGSAKDVNDGGK